MADAAVSECLAEGDRLLASTDWAAAADAFDFVLAIQDHPAAHDGLATARWWLRDVDQAIAERTAAYAGFRRLGQDARAFRSALWLAREYAEALGNDPVSRGWLARAEGLASGLPDGVDGGWLAVTRGLLRADPVTARDDARTALTVARSGGDPDLEATALALLGLGTIAAGDVPEGMTLVDEAMVVVTAGELRDKVVFGDICCMVTRASEEACDTSRLGQWNKILLRFMESTGHPALLEFCGTCCAEIFLASGDIAGAEGWLSKTLRELEQGGHRARCVHPAAKLAELRLLQGRVEEASRLLSGFEDRPDALRASAAVRLAAGDTAVAAALLHRRIHQVGEGLLIVPLLALLAEVELEQGVPGQALATAGRLDDVAAATRWPRAIASSHLTGGRVAAAVGNAASAQARLDAAITIFGELNMPLEAAKARLALAEALRDSDREVAVHEAGVALAAFDEAGASGLADKAAALLRALGGPARTGPKALGLLSRREREVLALLAEAMTNAEIADRLFISAKTAEHHVSSILAKLQLRSRGEAAALALRSSLMG
ncbi:response regulator transcription factor [Pseudarthrobacter cellobiosi]|uniref:response regulator transcription factor n=1 Tax=Pseudarthrobacter cellobiosi TaxID=2953654 RepID=UPI00208DE804|nr:MULTISPECIES: LuxR C-terminal-related transcriptional regulator [unclassified Pseudarthrobacter]MCO4254221.1 LuxR C-terminal-related transcriptional regulator [Pseudarthrobacter sp. HLT1-5]MCO4275873.1 LuxR C-terminal-related transcriptional regulator [Pseudarthrobacter sp. HLT3-5]